MEHNKMLWSIKQSVGTYKIAEEFILQLNTEKHLNKDNWRLPTIEELFLAHENKISGFYTDIRPTYWANNTNNFNFGNVVYFNSHCYINFISTKSNNRIRAISIN